MTPIQLVAAITVTVCVVTLVGYGIYLRRRNTGPAATSTQQKVAVSEDSRRLPYRFDHGMVFVWDQAVWAGVRIQGTSDGYLPQERLEGLAAEAAAALVGLGKDSEPVNVQVRLTHKPVNASAWLDQLLDHAWNPTALYRTYSDRIARTLRYHGTSTPVIYLFVQIAHVDKTTSERLLQAANVALMGGADEFVAPEVAAEWEARAKQVIEKLRIIGGVEPTTRDDRMWIIRKTLSGHFVPALDDYPRTKIWGAGEYLLWLDFRADNARSHIVIHTHNEAVDEPDRSPDQSDLVSYTACLAVADWPEESVLTGNKAWLRWLAKRPERPEVMYRMEVIPPTQLREDMQKALNNLRGEQADLAKAKRNDVILDRDAARADEVVTALRQSPVPGVRGQIIIQLSAPTEAALQSMVDSLILAARWELNDTVLVRPRRWQWRMLQMMLPGSETKIPAIPYVRVTDPSMFGAAVPNGTSHVGDRTVTSRAGLPLGWHGDYIGMGEDPVFFSPHVGPARDAGGGVAILGASGSGKSNLAMLLFFLASEAGTSVDVIDPKVDFAQFCYYMSFGPQVNDPDFENEAAAGTLGKPGSKFYPTNQPFWDDTEIVDVASSRPGVFDAWAMEKSIHAGQLLAMDQMQLFLGPDWTLFRSHVQEAMAGVVAQSQAAGERPSMWKVATTIIDEATRIRATADAEGRILTEPERQRLTLGLVMQSLVELPYASLVFANTSETFRVSQKRRIIYTLRGMPIPSGKTPAEHMTASQRFAVAIMYLLTRVASSRMSQSVTTKPGTTKRGYAPKLLIIDEANMVVGLEQGAQMVKESFGKGRSYNFATILIDQQAARIAAIEEGDAGSGDATANQINTVFGFAQKSLPEARQMLPLYGRDPSNPDEADLATRLLRIPNGDLETGVTLMRDVDGNIGWVEVQLIFRELAAAMDTNPSTRALSQSRPVSADPNQWSPLGDDEIDAAKQAAERYAEDPEEVVA